MPAPDHSPSAPPESATSPRLDPPRLDPVATTSRLTAAMRAQESRRPDALIDDPLAVVLAGEQGMEMLVHTQADAASDAIVVRSRWFDDRITAVLADPDHVVEQMVVVAAGMDTRAWRLDRPTATAFYELDRPALLEMKAHLLSDRAPAPGRVAVGVDLTGDWPAALGAAGHDPDRPTCWLVEGLLQYLAEPDVLGLLDRVTTASAPGSHLLVDVVGAALLEVMRPSPMLQRFERLGMPWIFGTDDLGGLLGERGWSSTVVAFGEVAAALGRSSPAGPDGADGYLAHARR